MSEHGSAASLGWCVHDHCPLDGPHWHAGIWRSSHKREHAAQSESAPTPESKDAADE